MDKDRSNRPAPTVRALLSTALVAMSLVTLLVFWGLQLFTRISTERAASADRQLRTASDAARSVSSFIEERFAVLEAIVWVSDIDALSPSGRDTMLQSLIGLHPSLTVVTLHDADGNLLAAQFRLPKPPTSRPSHVDEALASTRTHLRYISPVYFDAETSEPRVLLAVPVLGARHDRLGSMLAELNLKFMWDMIAELKVGRTGYAYVVDGRGRLIGFGDASRVLRGETPRSLPPVARFLANRSSQGAAEEWSYLGLDGRRVVGAYSPLRTPDWAVVTELPFSEAYGLLIRDTWVGMGVISVLAVGAAIVGARFGRRLAQPVVRLVDAVTRLASGERPGTTVEVSGPRELADLAVAFNSMSAQLQQSVDGLEQQIAEARRAKEALAESELRHRTLADAAFEGIAFSRGGVFVDSNDQFLAMLGATRDDVVGAPVASWVGEESREMIDRYIAEERTEPYENTLVTKDGRRIDIEVRARYAGEGAARTRISAVRDITESRATERALRENEYFLRKSQDVGDVGSYYVDLRSGTWLASPKMDEIFGISSVYERNIDGWLAIVHPDDREACRRHLSAEVIAARGRFDQEYRVIRRTDGALRWVHGLGELEFDDAGVPVKMIGTIQDVTDRRLAADEIRRLNEELEGRVRQRTAELEVANHELEAFAYSVSHDLRAPLRAIDGYSLILLEDHVDSLSDDGRRVCGIVRSETLRMAQLIDDLLAFSRFSRAEMKRARLDMRALVDSIYVELTTSEARERVDLVVSPLPNAVGDPSLMRQVWTNLLSNALKFSSKRERARIEIRGAKENGTVTYQVCDNGAGFDMAYADKLFGVFQRLHGQRQYPGTGVGLAIVKRIVQRHGGQVWAEGVPDGGATFQFSLPEEGA
jgi:PAS domain S-box-containing protein